MKAHISDIVKNVIRNSKCIDVATVVTHDHIDQALTLKESMDTYRPVRMHILVVDGDISEVVDKFRNDSSITINCVDELSGIDFAGLIISKYSDFSNIPDHINKYDYLRWSLKPVYLTSILNSGIRRVLFCDCDLCFYANFDFLIDLLNDNRIILSPHWRPMVPFYNNNEYKYNFAHGYFNAGFIGVREDAIDMLLWWSEMCSIECSVSSASTYVDQKYLDIVPLYFGGVYIIKHKGCNVAGWNTYQLPRINIGGKISVGGDDLIFIHYSGVTICRIIDGLDNKLAGCYKQYTEMLNKKRKELIKLGLSVSGHESDC